jgi:hypothetical protein
MSGPARPPLYKPERASRPREMCGDTNPDLARRPGVVCSTIGRWIGESLRRAGD